MSLLVDIKKTTDKTDEYMAKSVEQFDTIKLNINELTSTIADLQKRLTAIESKTTTSIDSKKTATDEIAKQESLRKNVCIFGVPYCENENLNGIIASIGKAANYNISHDDYTNGHRAGTNNVLIIATFVNFRKKLEFLAAKKTKRTIRTTELGLSTSIPDQPVFINYHLTPYFSKIFNMGRKAVADKMLAACWVSFNCICVRKTSTDDKCLINDIKDMERICAKKQNSTIVSVPPTQPTPEIASTSAVSTRSQKRKAVPSQDKSSASKIAKSTNINPTELSSRPMSPKITTTKVADGPPVNSNINDLQVNVSNTSDKI